MRSRRDQSLYQRIAGRLHVAPDRRQRFRSTTDIRFLFGKSRLRSGKLLLRDDDLAFVGAQSIQSLDEQANELLKLTNRCHVLYPTLAGRPHRLRRRRLGKIKRLHDGDVGGEERFHLVNHPADAR